MQKNTVEGGVKFSVDDLVWVRLPSRSIGRCG